MINGAAALAELIRPASEADEFGTHRVLPVLPELGNLLPSRGLRRGSTIAIGITPGPTAPRSALPTASRGGSSRQLDAGGYSAQPTSETGSGNTSLLLALLAAASHAGSWCAVVGVPALGAIAAAESGIALDRLALVPNPGPEWPTVTAALIDGVDVVVIAVPDQVSTSITSRLVARARQRGCVLVPYGRWDGADVTLQVTQGQWEGLHTGRGRLRRRKVTVVARGRGAAARPKEITMWMPGTSLSPPQPPIPSLDPVRDRDAVRDRRADRDAILNRALPRPVDSSTPTASDSLASVTPIATPSPGSSVAPGAAPLASVVRIASASRTSPGAPLVAPPGGPVVSAVGAAPAAKVLRTPPAVAPPTVAALGSGVLGEVGFG